MVATLIIWTAYLIIGVFITVWLEDEVCNYILPFLSLSTYRWAAPLVAIFWPIFFAWVFIAGAGEE